MTTCPVCGGDLVEVDNPLRKEFRHRRGVVCPSLVVSAGDTVEFSVTDASFIDTGVASRPWEVSVEVPMSAWASMVSAMRLQPNFHVYKDSKSAGNWWVLHCRRCGTSSDILCQGAENAWAAMGRHQHRERQIPTWRL